MLLVFCKLFNMDIICRAWKRARKKNQKYWLLVVGHNNGVYNFCKIKAHQLNWERITKLYSLHEVDLQRWKKKPNEIDTKQVNQFLCRCFRFFFLSFSNHRMHKDVNLLTLRVVDNKFIFSFNFCSFFYYVFLNTKVCPPPLLSLLWLLEVLVN